ncbi:monovalent cation/H(+) antiporter subunit G [Lactococcus kimchii]|uniref:monovalent cation/H(+) antiporter subunit G n=1 Tax=Lactococcus sp. S-13 TaxID=2507158 RepID=UPI0010238E23|nr:monovalent cation/H(+) antiporter subunit G [Lactococcus sp. S-13]RZI49570.1 hypothetical protein EQJ87_09125 [Lactococcus sp. S-13]
MSTWGIALISLGLLLIAYRNWFGLLIVLIGLAMMLVARSQKKKADKLEKEKLQAYQETKIKSRK